MSVFVDIVPDESHADSVAARPSKNKWRGRLTRAALPLLSVLVFGIAWQLTAASGIWNQTFVPYPSTVWKAFIDVSTTHDGTRGYAGYLLWEHLYMTLRRVFAAWWSVSASVWRSAWSWGPSGGCAACWNRG